MGESLTEKYFVFLYAWSPTHIKVDIFLHGNSESVVCLKYLFRAAVVVIAPKLVKRVDWIFSGFSEEFEWNNFLNRAPRIF